MTARIDRARSPYLTVAVVTAAALILAAHQVGWRYLFLTADQRGRVAMERGHPAAAAERFRDPLWRGVALFRAGDFKAAAQVLSGLDTAEGAYDQGNALIMLGQYDDAMKRYDRALEIRPGWADAATNREIARIRGERRKTEGGETDDTESKPDEIVFDKTKKGGTETEVEGESQPMSDQAVRAMWLKRVQTRPADFLRAKFAYQLQSTGQEPKP
ncbi:MAG: tetratricopeptide repeat protein [Aestuariivirgaceae bacterium]